MDLLDRVQKISAPNMHTDRDKCHLIIVALQDPYHWMYLEKI